MATASLPSLQTISWSSLQVEELIGSGGYGNVYRGYWYGKEVAIKELLLKKLPEHLIKDFENETRIMSECQSSHIIHLFGVCLEPGHYAMVMDYMAKGSLYQVLHNEKEVFPWNPLRLRVANDICKGLLYLHKKGILHRDLKSLNVLLDLNYHAKITDFGLAKIKLETNSTSTQSLKSLGTVRWLAPELLKRGALPTTMSDIYSLGMVLWEIASRKLPYEDAPNEMLVMNWVGKGEQEKIPMDCPEKFVKAIQHCWVLNPENRGSALEIQHAIEELEEKVETLQDRSWHIHTDQQIQPVDIGQKYILVPASDRDLQKVKDFYSHHPVQGYEIKSVKVIVNPSLEKAFSIHLEKLQERVRNSAFDPKWTWELEGDPQWRQKVYNLYVEMAKPFTDPDYPDVKLLPLWHGTDPKIVDSICRSGYANLATTDSGFFGKGLYSTYEADYAFRVYSKGALILNWVAIYSAFPVIEGDMSKLSGKGNYKNYDAHFIPVSPKDPQNPKEMTYYPSKPHQNHTSTEVVVFESAACLPRYLIELESREVPTQLSAFLSTTKPRNSSGRQAPSLVIGKRDSHSEISSSKSLQRFSPSETPKVSQPEARSASLVIEKSGIKLETPAKPSHEKTSSQEDSGSNPTGSQAQYELGLRLSHGEGVQQDLSRAVRCFHLAADKGHLEAQFELGLRYFDGKGVERDYFNAVKYFEFAAKGGHARAQRLLAVCYVEEKGVDHSYDIPLPSLHLLANENNPGALFCIGRFYFEGKNVKQDLATAIKYFQRAAELGEKDAQYYLGLCYLDGKGTVLNYWNALKYLRLAADQGHPKAQFEVGFTYFEGRGIKSDDSTAFRYFKSSADQRQPDGLYYVAICYRDGRGIEKDEKKYIEYLKLAAEQKHEKALNTLIIYYLENKLSLQEGAAKHFQLAAANGDVRGELGLGLCHFSGAGVKQDYGQAVNYFKSASDKEYAQAQCEYGICCFEGKGIDQDFINAAIYFQLAADHKYPKGQYYLGQCYQSGKGVRLDIPTAIKLFQLAAESGEVSAQSTIGHMYLEGTEVEQNYSLAVKYLKTAAMNNDTKSQLTLAKMCFAGQGVERDEIMGAAYAEMASALYHFYFEGRAFNGDLEANFKQLKVAAGQGIADAQYYLGLCYKKGKLVDKDQKKALVFFQLAADKNHLEARFEFGLHYYKLGEYYYFIKTLYLSDGKFAYSEAVKHFQIAADQGHARAQYHLGYCYHEGHGTKQSHQKAVEYFTLSANQGNPIGQLKLGQCYLKGEGVQKNYDEAQRLFLLAEKQGNKDAKMELEKLSKKLEKGIK